jgi:hypothetical protein
VSVLAMRAVDWQAMHLSSKPEECARLVITFIFNFCQ